MQTATAVVPNHEAKVQAAVASVEAQIMDLLRLEARNALLSAAEASAPEDMDDEVSGPARRWYGFDLVPQDKVRRLQAQAALLELKLKTTFDNDERAAIKQELDGFQHALHGIHAQIQRDVELRREYDVQQRAEVLRTQYERLAMDLPFNPYHPAVPASLRRWVLRQQKLGAFEKQPIYRLYCYLILRDTVFTAMGSISAPVIDLEPDYNTLALAGTPRSKQEQRELDIMERQFCHANGDRRIARDTQLTRMDATRRAASSRGEQFHDRYDHNEPEYDGVPSLPVLWNLPPKKCSDCGGSVVDRIREAPQVEGADPGTWQYVSACECTEDIIEDGWASRDALEEHVLERELQRQRLDNNEILERLRSLRGRQWARRIQQPAHALGAVPALQAA